MKANAAATIDQIAAVKNLEDEMGTFYLFGAPRIASVQNMVTTTTL